MLGGHIPDGFWVVWEGPPYLPHSLGDGSKCRRGKGLKTICIASTRTSDTSVDAHGAGAATIPYNSLAVVNLIMPLEN